MTYFDYHKILLNEAVVDLRITIKRRLRLTSTPRILSSNTEAGIDKDTSAMARYNKINNMLINGKVKADDEVNFEMLDL